jgi:hypothetical protein
MNQASFEYEVTILVPVSQKNLSVSANSAQVK